MEKTMETRILDAALDVIDKNTISGTRMHLIAETAGTSQSNLHYHFKTKNELLVALLDYLQENFVETRNQMLQTYPDSLRGQLTGFLEQKRYYTLNEPKYDRVQIDFWSWGQIDPQINASIDRSFAIWRENIVQIVRRYAPEQSEEKANLLAHIMVSMMFGATLQYLTNPTTFSTDEYNQACLSMLESFIS